MTQDAFDFIDRGGEAAWLSPSVFVDPTLYCFAVPVDPHCVRDLLTRYIDQPAVELRCPIDVDTVLFDVVRPAGSRPVPLAFFVFIDSVRRQGPPDNGSLQRSPGLAGREREHLFAILLPAIKREGSAEELVFFAPYVFASSSPGWRVEREIYGYPQQQGQVRIELDGAGAVDLSVEARGIDQFGRDKLSRERRFLQVTRTDLAPSVMAESRAEMGIREVCARVFRFENVTAQSSRSMPVNRTRQWASGGVADFVAREPVDARPPEPFRTRPNISLDQWLSGPLSMLFLKQFRDIVHSDRACYQAIIQADLTASAPPVATELGLFELNLTDLDSIPIRRELGIAKNPVVAHGFQLRIPPSDNAGALGIRIEEAAEPRLSIEGARVLSNPRWNPAGELSVADVPSRLPRYVERGGELVWRQPSRLEGALIYGFGVKVPLSRQHSLLESCINDIVKNSHIAGDDAAAPFTLTTAGLDLVMLLFVDYQRIASGTDDDERLGGIAYREFLALQLALRRAGDFPELNWYIPFIYLDADSPRVAGREIYGYPKQHGQINILPLREADGAPQPAQSLELSATVIHDPADAEAQQHATIISVHRKKSELASRAPEPVRVEQLYDDASEMFADLLRHISSTTSNPRACRILLENAQLSNIGNVFLKEFRDCVDPRRTCYQAVCKTDTIPGRFRSGGRLDPSGYRISVPRHTSEPLFQYLAAEEGSGEDDEITPVFAYWLDIDFELTRGRVIANSFTPRPAGRPHAVAPVAAAPEAAS